MSYSLTLQEKKKKLKHARNVKITFCTIKETILETLERKINQKVVDNTNLREDTRLYCFKNHTNK